jgi:hypothetical protein
VRRGQALADDRGFESDDGATSGQSLGDLGRHSEEFVHGRAPARATAPAATKTARPAASIGVAPSR